MEQKLQSPSSELSSNQSDVSAIPRVDIALSDRDRKGEILAVIAESERWLCLPAIREKLNYRWEALSNSTSEPFVL